MIEIGTNLKETIEVISLFALCFATLAYFFTRNNNSV